MNNSEETYLKKKKGGIQYFQNIFDQKSQTNVILFLKEHIQNIWSPALEHLTFVLSTLVLKKFK